MFKRKEKLREIYSDYNILKIFIKKSFKVNGLKKYKTLFIIAGICSFECECYENDLVFLSSYLPLYEKENQKVEINKSLLSISPKIDSFKELPLKNLIYLFTSNAGTNLNKFYEKILKALDEEGIENNQERMILILENLVDNRQKYLNYFHAIDLPINNWIFATNTINTKHHFFEELSNFISFEEDNKTMRINDYVNTQNFNELYQIITKNKELIFKKELKNYIKERIIISHKSSNNENINFVNVELFKQIETLFSLEDSEKIKSIKEFNFYLNKIQKIALDSDSAFIINKINTSEDLITLCNMFKNKPLEVLKRLNIPFHLLEGNVKLLKKYYETNKEKLDISKEKKLYYFLNQLSKRISQNTKDFKLVNPNEGYNNSELLLHHNKLRLKTINSFDHLYKLGIELNNCAGNYETIDSYTNKYNFVVYDKETRKKYIGQIDKGQFRQFKGYKNESPSFDLFKIVFKTLNKLGHLADIQKQKNKSKTHTFESLYEKECVHKIYIS